MGSVRVHAVPVPHTSHPATLERQRQIYSRGQTPVRGADGTVRALETTPAGPALAGRHLDEIADRYGEPGLARSINGLSVARGWDFAQMAVHHASSSVQRRSTLPAVAACTDPLAAEGEQPVFAATTAMRQSRGNSVPGEVRSFLPATAQRALDGARLHDDHFAHAAARALGARAVTVGRSVYLGEGEYQPSTTAGRHLLAHEVAHTLQEHDTTAPATHRLRVSDPASPDEREANSFADAVVAGELDAPIPRRSTASSPQLRRVISFTAVSPAPTGRIPGVLENAPAATFRIANGVPVAPHFNWAADVTIHGNAGDPFANFQAGPLQILRSWYFNVWWGTGANRTHRRGTVPTPIRDALTAGNTWYADVLASANFAAAGDVRATGLNDSPGIPTTPIANPVAGRASTRGWFNYGAAFVAFISARDTTAVGAGAFRHLSHVYWNLSINGSFDATRPAGARVTVRSAATNVSRVFSGGSAADPPIIGGPVPNAAAVITTT